MNTATIILLVLTFIGLGVSMANHGKAETKTVNFGTSLLSTIILLTLYHFAGLF